MDKNKLSELEQAYNGKHMRPIILLTDAVLYHSVLTEESYIVPKSEWDQIADNEDLVCDIEYKQVWLARLSADGYLDCTDWNMFKSWAEAVDSLLLAAQDEE